MKKKIALVGDASSLFLEKQALALISSGLDVQIICFIHESTKTSNGIDIISSFYKLKRNKYFQLKLIFHLLKWLEILNNLIFSKRIKKSMKTEKEGRISFSYSYHVCKVISIYLNSHTFDGVIINDAFAFGLVSSFVKNKNTIIMPWGADIYLHCNTSFYAKSMVFKSLHSCKYIMPSGFSSKQYISNNFKINENKIKVIPWGIDIKEMDLLSMSKKNVLNKYVIPDNKLIVTNSRRFRPSWGSEIVSEVFVELAKFNSNIHFVIFGGETNNIHVKKIKTEITKNNLENQFTLIDYQIPMEDYIQIIQNSIISFSLMVEDDMLSGSIMQSAFSQCILVLSKTGENIILNEKGLYCCLVDWNTEDIIKQSKNILSNLEFYLSESNKNREFIMNELNQVKQVAKIKELLLTECVEY